jgi:hypothetical protein
LREQGGRRGEGVFFRAVDLFKKKKSYFFFQYRFKYLRQSPGLIMGINGLLPLLNSIQRPIHIRNLKGETVGIDAYCWLHKACYSCAQDLALGIPTVGFLDFCIYRIELLLHHGVIPMMVFDGRSLPMKGEKERERRE